MLRVLDCSRSSILVLRPFWQRKLRLVALLPLSMPTVDRSLSWPARSTSHVVQIGVNPSDSSSTGSSTISIVRTRTGSRLPKWREVIRNGGNATTGLTAQWDSLECGNANELIREETVSQSPSQHYVRTTTHTGPLPVIEYGAGRVTCLSPVMDTTAAENRASAAFYKKLRSQTVIFSGPTFLGELTETLHMLHRPAAALYGSANGYLDALSKAKRASPKHWLKTISGLWLEHSFGWKPLINDVFDASKAYRSLGKPRQKIISAGAADTKDTTSSLTWGNGIYAAGSSGATRHSVSSISRDTTIVRYKGKLQAQVEMTQWDNWALFGFTPSEFIPTAWELLPWSFLVDYFTNVGDILASSITSTNNVVFVNKTVIRNRTFYGTIRPATLPNSNPATTVQNIGSCGFNAKRRTVTRSAGVSVPLPTLHFETGLSDGQLFNVAALLGQARALHGQNSPRNWHR